MTNYGCTHNYFLRNLPMFNPLTPGGKKGHTNLNKPVSFN